MGEIKSAYEKALERFENVKPDPQIISKQQAIEEGKHLFVSVLQKKLSDIIKTLSEKDEQYARWMKQGLGEVLLINTQLSESQSHEEVLAAVEHCVQALSGETTQHYVFLQLREASSQYIQERNRVVETLRAQFEQVIGQSERAASQQYGTPVKIDPASHPEFARMLREQINQLKVHFAPAVQKVKEQIINLCELSYEHENN